MSDNQFVVFKLGNEKYGVDILNVGGISEYLDITKVPDAPWFIEGIINLRGDIIPVVNLEKRFNIPVKEIDSESRIIIIKIQGKDIGFLVDEASQVLRIESEDIEDAPEIIKGKDHDYISGVGKYEGQIIILLDLVKVLNAEEAAQVIQLKE